MDNNQKAIRALRKQNKALTGVSTTASTSMGATPNFSSVDRGGPSVGAIKITYEDLKELLHRLNIHYASPKYLWTLRKVFQYVISMPKAPYVGGSSWLYLAKDIAGRHKDKRFRVTRQFVANAFRRFKADGILLQVVVRDKKHTQYIVVVDGEGDSGVQWEVVHPVFDLFISILQNRITPNEHHNNTIITPNEHHNNTNPYTVTRKPIIISNQEQTPTLEEPDNQVAVKNGMNVIIGHWLNGLRSKGIEPLAGDNGVLTNALALLRKKYNFPEYAKARKGSPVTMEDVQPYLDIIDTYFRNNSGTYNAKFFYSQVASGNLLDMQTVTTGGREAEDIVFYFHRVSNTYSYWSSDMIAEVKGITKDAWESKIAYVNERVYNGVRKATIVTKED